LLYIVAFKCATGAIRCHKVALRCATVALQLLKDALQLLKDALQLRYYVQLLATLIRFQQLKINFSILNLILKEN